MNKLILLTLLLLTACKGPQCDVTCEGHQCSCTYKKDAVEPPQDVTPTLSDALVICES